MLVKTFPGGRHLPPVPVYRFALSHLSWQINSLGVPAVGTLDAAGLIGVDGRGVPALQVLEHRCVEGWFLLSSEEGHVLVSGNSHQVQGPPLVERLIPCRLRRESYLLHALQSLVLNGLVLDSLVLGQEVVALKVVTLDALVVKALEG